MTTRAKRGTAKRKTAKRGTPRTRTRRAPTTLARNAALEDAIVAAPLDPEPRMIYGDWLQSLGEARGEWVALSTAIEAELENLALRALGVAFVDDHQRELLGDGARVLRGGWLGWRGGFVDEIRLHPPGRAEAEALLAHPTCRFVRHVAIGDFPDARAVASAVVAAPPLLESLLVVDKAGTFWGKSQRLDELATLRSLRTLALRGFTVGAPMPQLIELSIATPMLRTSEAIAWIVGGGCANVEELLIDCANVRPAEVIAEVVTALPRLRRLRLLHLQSCDAVIEMLVPWLARLELLDLSHSDLSDRGVELVASSGEELELVAIRTQVSTTAIERAKQVLPRATITHGAPQSIYHVVDDRSGGSWLTHRLHHEGRDALRTFPGAGRMLFNLSTKHASETALRLLRASLTLPDSAIGTYPYANAAGALERLERFDEAELVSREGLLRSPLEPNLMSFAIDALRRSNRLARALALVPRALTTLVKNNPDPIPHQGATRTACLVDCLFTLAQAGRHDDVIALATEHAKLVDARAHAIVAMSRLALGKLAAARRSAEKAGQVEAVAHHAHAALLVRAGQTKRALARLVKARDARYSEWHWLATDPNLAPLRDDAAFQALLIAPPRPRDEPAPVDDMIPF